MVDNLTSGVRAGLSLPEALSAIGVRGPEQLREPFKQFGSDYRTTGRFNDSLDRLKDALADPVGDRVCESLRVAREVGGTDLGRLLSTLSGFLRDDARTRAELLARQSWSVNAARMAVAAPWLVLILLATQRETLQAYDTPTGTVILASGAALSLDRLPADDPDRAAARGPAGAPVNLTLLGALLGGLAAAGLLLAVLASPPMRRPTMSDRIAPYLTDAAAAVAAADRPDGRRHRDRRSAG